MTPILRGQEFNDLHDVFSDADGNVALLNIMVPFANSRADDSVQKGYQILARFAKTAPFGQIYWALYLPFFSDVNPDSRLDGAPSSIMAPIMEGPYELGVSGPAVFHNSTAVAIIPTDDDPDGGTPVQITAEAQNEVA